MDGQAKDVAQRGFTLGQDEAEGRFEDPSFWEGCVYKRIFAYFVDVAVLAFVWTALGLVGFITLGLFAPLIALAWGLAPLAYHTLMVSQRGATLGQNVMGLRVVNAKTGENPTFLQALILTIGFYVSLAFWFIPFAYFLFDDRDRFLHDVVSNTRTLRADKIGQPEIL